MFVVVSCFEVALRNRIDAVMKAHLGNDWLRDLILPGGARKEFRNELFFSYSACFAHFWIWSRSKALLR